MAEPDDSQLPEDSSQPLPEDDIEALLAQAESLASNLAEETDVGPEERAGLPEAAAGGVEGSDALETVEQATGELDEIESLLKEAETQAADVLGLGDTSNADGPEEETSEAVQEEQESQDSGEETSAEKPSDAVSEDTAAEDAEPDRGDGAVEEESPTAKTPETESDLEPDSAVLSDLVGDPDVDLSEPGEEAQAAVQAATEAVEKEAKAGEKRAEASAKEKSEAKPDAKADAKTKAKDSAKKNDDTAKDDNEKDGNEKDRAASGSLKARLIGIVKEGIPVVVQRGRHAAITTRRIVQNAVLELFVTLDRPFGKLPLNTKKYMGIVGLVTVVMGGLMWVLPKLLESNPYLDMPPFPPVEP